MFKVYFLIILMLFIQFDYFESTNVLLNHKSIENIINDYIKFYERKNPIKINKPSNREHFQQRISTAGFQLHSVSESNIKYRENSPRMPSSFAILMNFKEDGTSSVQLMESMESVYWYDAGHCKHGQMYNPLSKRCSDILCLAGSILFQSDNGYRCVKDENSTISEHHDDLCVPDEIVVEMTIEHKLCTFDHTSLNDHLCNNKSLLNYKNLSIEIHKSIANILSSTNERIENLQIVNNKTYILNFDESDHDDFDNSNENENYYDDDVNELNFNQDGVFIDNPVMSHSGIKSRLNLGESKKSTFTEKIVVQFIIRDQKLFDLNIEKQKSIELYYNLVAIGFFKTKDKLLGRKILYSNVIEKKNSNNLEWCTNTGYNKKTLTDSFRILNDKDNKYYIFDKNTYTLYPAGYFYLTIIYKTKEKGPKIDRIKYKQIQNSTQSKNPIYFDQKILIHLNLTDITDEILEKNNTNIITFAYLIVCDRPAKIRNRNVTCPNLQTIKIRICEFNYHENNKSFHFPLLNKDYSVDEYEYDPIEPNKYIRVCNFIDDSMKEKIKKEPNVTLMIHGYISFVSIIISLTALFGVLITYIIFDQLRNIPGWNLIFLSIALIIAQSSFLAGSILSKIPVGCFILALLTHYGYLASFFWMNVIAFDLYRNFRDKASHILINTVRVRSRISKYALYGWLSPFLIVFSGVMIDLYLKEPSLNRLRPCYAGYIEGCNKPSLFELKDENDFANKTLSDYENNNNNSTVINKCNDNMIDLILTKTCWIMHGTANFMVI